MVLLGAISQEDENLMRGATKTLEEVYRQRSDIEACWIMVKHSQKRCVMWYMWYCILCRIIVSHQNQKLWWSNRIAIIFCHVLMILSYSVSARNCLSGFDQRHWSTSGVRLRVAWADCSGAAKGLAAAKAGPWNIWHHNAPTKVNKRVIESRVGDGQWWSVIQLPKILQVLVLFLMGAVPSRWQTRCYNYQ